MDKVRAGATYIFERNGYDRIMSHADVKNGQWVKVVNLPSAPKCNTMGQCHIQDLKTGEFLGMVDVRSLRRPAKEFTVQVYSANAWEDVTTETTKSEAFARLKEYRQNTPYSYRLITRMEKP